MKNKSRTAHIFVSMFGASLSLYGTGCAAEKPPVPLAPTLTSGDFTPSPTLPPPGPAVVPVSPSVNVSAELAAACQLKFNNVDTAPKFDFDQSHLVADDNEVLSQIAMCLTTGPLAGRSLDLVGRADPRGDSRYNMALGNRRAITVRDYLSGLGVGGPNLSLSSRGKRDATGTDEAGWQIDRRVDILLH